MSTLTELDAEWIPTSLLPLFEVRVRLADQTRDIRVRARDRFDAAEQVLEHRRGWELGTVKRYQAGRWIPS